MYSAVQVSRIENAELWRKYASARHLLASDKHPPITNIQTVTQWFVNKCETSTNHCRNPGLKSNVNEFFLFHVSMGMEDKISLEGFTKETLGIFGQGFYFSDDVRAYPQFTKSGSEEDWKVFVCRVCLGTAIDHVCTTPAMLASY
jgi:hypothetical protein